MSSKKRSFCLFGCSLDTGNLGVSALGLSAIKGVRTAYPDAEIYLQTWSGTQNDPALGRDAVEVDDVHVHCMSGLRDRNSICHIKTLNRIASPLPGFLGNAVVNSNASLKKLMNADAILDVSGGDAFADIYGPRRVELQFRPKELALELGKPLVLLPQTYGPYKHDASVQRMKKIVTQSAIAGTRDSTGVEELKTWCDGAPLDHAVMRPDMAFMLDADKVDASQEPAIDWDGSIIGLNVSGMLYLTNQDYGLAADYVDFIHRVIEWGTSLPNTRVMLVPHVIARTDPSSLNESLDTDADVSDTLACMRVMEKLGDRYGEKLACIGWPYTASQTKYLIAQCDFFLGARMHSCIGAVSQCVPTANLAYSKKASGLMTQVGIPETVVDLRALDSPTAIERCKELYAEREAIHTKMNGLIPAIKQQSMQFFTHDLRKLLGDEPI